MPGTLAGLFAGHSTQALTNVKQSVAASKPASPSEIHEQLRALNDSETVLQGGPQFAHCQCAQRACLLVAFLRYA